MSILSKASKEKAQANAKTIKESISNTRCFYGNEKVKKQPCNSSAAQNKSNNTLTSIGLNSQEPHVTHLNSPVLNYETRWLCLKPAYAIWSKCYVN